MLILPMTLPSLTVSSREPDLLKDSQLIRYFVYGMTVASRSEDQQIHLPCLGNCALGRPVHSVEQRRIGF